MAKVSVTKTITVRPTETSSVQYEAGFEGTAPTDHIERIVAAGAGERINTAEEKPKGKGGEQA